MKTTASVLCIFSILSFVGCSITFVKPTPEQTRIEVKAAAQTGTYFALRSWDKNDSNKLKSDAKALKESVQNIDWTKPVDSKSVLTLLKSRLNPDAAVLFQFATDLINAHIDTGSSFIIVGDNLLLIKALFEGIADGCDLAIASV